MCFLQCSTSSWSVASCGIPSHPLDSYSPQQVQITPFAWESRSTGNLFGASHPIHVGGMSTPMPLPDSWCGLHKFTPCLPVLFHPWRTPNAFLRYWRSSFWEYEMLPHKHLLVLTLLHFLLNDSIYVISSVICYKQMVAKILSIVQILIWFLLLKFALGNLTKFL